MSEVYEQWLKSNKPDYYNERSGRDHQWWKKEYPNPNEGKEGIMEAAQSQKFDSNKTRYSLLYWPFIRGLAKVLEYGAKLYGENSWKGLPDANRRYLDAAIRHLMDSEKDLDYESGLDHLLHAGCNIMFLYYMRNKEKK